MNIFIYLNVNKNVLYKIEQLINMQGMFTKDGTVSKCAFCDVIKNRQSHYRVFEDEISFAFLDRKPVFRGHTLVVPKEHYEALDKLPEESLGNFFSNVRLISKGVEIAMHSDGTFVAINNKVSQSVPHLHVHVVPRKFNDGLHGFFWPRTAYRSEDELIETQSAIESAIRKLRY